MPGWEGVSPPKLNVEPVLVGRVPIVVVVLRVMQQTGLGHWPLVRREQDKVGTTAVHLVGFARVDRLLLHALDLQCVKLLVEHLHNIHGDGLVNLLPQVRPKME